MEEFEVYGEYGCPVRAFVQSDGTIQVSVLDDFGDISKEQAKQLGEWLIKQS